MTCDARSLLATTRTPGVASDMIANCAREPHDDDRHEGGITFSDGFQSPTIVTWYEADRRTFRGELVLCDQSDCPLPAGHRGGHAT